MSVEISITDQIVEINEVSNPVEISVSAGAVVQPVWGGITGTLSNQTDLQNALNAKFDDPTGTTAQYLRGDGSLATFPSFPVTSVFGRTGSVVATEGDYTLTQLGDVTLTSPTNGQVLKYNGTSWVNNTDTDTGLTSVGLTMPSAFSVANSPLTSNGTLAVTGAGTAAQYIRGDGQLANFPDNQGGGSSVNYYLNGSVTQGTFGGTTYYEMSKTPIIGAGTNFTRTNAQGNGYIASFITDAGDPSLLNIPAGNWNVEFYFQANTNAGNPQFYAELYKVSSADVFTLIASGSTNPEGITNGTTIDLYYTAIPVPQTSLLVTDRLAIRIFVIPAGRTITLHTENSNLCEVLTTLSTGLNALNGLTSQVQYFATGTSGTDFAISSATDTHTFNLPTASATNRGALNSADWTTFNNKQNALTNPITGTGTSGQVAYFTGSTTQAGSNNLFWDNTNGRLGIGTNSPTVDFDITKSVGSAGAVTSLVKNSNSAGEGAFLIRNDSYYAGFEIFGSLFPTSVLRNTALLSTQNGITNLALATLGNANISFRTNSAGTTNERLTIFGGGNVSIGSTSDSGQRLQVTGDTLLRGSGATSGTSALTVQNSSSANILGALNDRTVYVGSASGSSHALEVNATANATRIAKFGNFEIVNNGSAGWTGVGLSIAGANRTLQFLPPSGNALNASDTIKTLFTAQGTTWSRTSGNAINFYIQDNQFAPTSGTATYFGLYINGGVNQTGGASGISRGLYIDYNIVAAADWRSIEWSNNSGWGLYGAGTANNYLNGRLGLGSTTLTAINLNVDLNISGAVQSVAIQQNGVVQSGVTSAAYGIFNGARLQSTAFTLTNYYHYWTQQSTLSGGSAITNQYGYWVDSTLIGATNNYGFYGNIASGTNRWNLYMQGTANNYMAGSLGIGQTTLTGSNLRISKAHTGSASAINFYIDSTIQSDVTNSPKVIATTLSTQAASFTVARATHYLANQGTIGAGSAITTQVGFEVDNTLIGATINYGFFGNIASGTNRWNLYMNGTAANYFNGNTLIGSTTDSGEKLQVTGTMKVTGASSFGGNMTLTINQNGNTNFLIANTTAGTSAQSTIQLQTSGGSGSIGKYSSTTTPYKFVAERDFFLYNTNAGGDIAFLNDFATGNIKFAAGGSSTAQMTIRSNGRINMSSLPTSATGLSAGDLWNDGGTLKIV